MPRPRLSVYAATALRGLRPGPADPLAERLPDTEVSSPDVVADPRIYARYCRLTGFGVTGELPVTFPHLLGFAATMRLFGRRDFPFPPVGMVHIGDRIVQHRAIDATEPLTVRVRLAGPREHRRGVGLAAVTELDAADGIVWRQTSDYLIRLPGRDAPAAQAQEPRPDDGPAARAPGRPLDLGTATAWWRVPADIGRRYAAVSGDYNPIHLYPLTARLFGLRRPIAHGMWTLARCLAALEPRAPRPPVRVDTRFRRPLPLPSPRVALTTERLGEGWSFAVADPASGEPFVTGTVAGG